MRNGAKGQSVHHGGFANFSPPNMSRWFAAAACWCCAKAKLVEMRGPTEMEAVQCTQLAKKPWKSGGAGLWQVGD